MTTPQKSKPTPSPDEVLRRMLSTPPAPYKAPADTKKRSK